MGHKRVVVVKTPSGKDRIVSFEDNVVHHIVHTGPAPWSNAVYTTDRGRDVDDVLRDNYGADHYEIVKDEIWIP